MVYKFLYHYDPYCVINSRKKKRNALFCLKSLLLFLIDVVGKTNNDLCFIFLLFMIKPKNKNITHMLLI